MKQFFNLSSLSDLHKFLGIAPPRHPLISVVDFSNMQIRPDMFTDKIIINDFYLISLKVDRKNNLIYGRDYYDFGEGSMIFMSPSQVFQVDGEMSEASEGWGLYFHPDLILGTTLHQRMDDYSFFNYAIREALHLSEKEKEVIQQIIENIVLEYDNNLDQHSQNLIVSNLELLLNYCQRFYNRQFLTRSKQNKDFIGKFNQLIKNYFKEERQLESGLISLNFLAKELNLSKSYLSDLVKKETGKTIKEIINLYIIELAKSTLLSTNKSVSEVAYDLGFEYPQYFSRLFKSKTGFTPSEFKSLN